MTRHSLRLPDDGNHYEAATVRPYAVTGGRVRSATSNLPLETLIEVTPGAVDSSGLTPKNARSWTMRHGTTCRSLRCLHFCGCHSEWSESLSQTWRTKDI